MAEERGHIPPFIWSLANEIGNDMSPRVIKINGRIPLINASLGTHPVAVLHERNTGNFSLS